MKIIEIEVGKKKYKISCNPEEENHILKLSKNLDLRYNKLANDLGEKASEGLILVIMALMQEDEITNRKKGNNSNSDIAFKLSGKVDSIIKKLENLKLA